MIEPQQGCVNSSKFLWHKRSDAMFVKYQPKARKTVYLLSTMHSTPNVDTTMGFKKTCVIGFYNEKNVGVDCCDLMARLCCTRSASRKWPLAIWSNILDITAINARVIFVKSTGNQISRRDFILALIECLNHKQQSKTSITLTPGSQKRRNVM